MIRIHFVSRYRGVNHYDVSHNGASYDISHRTSQDDSGYQDGLPVGYVRRLCNDPIDSEVVDALNALILDEYREYRDWHVKMNMPDSSLQPPPILATALNPRMSPVVA